MSDSLRPPWTLALQAPLSMEFSRKEYWSGGLGNIMYTLLRLEWIIHGNLPYRTWHSAQCYVPGRMGVGLHREWLHVYVCLSPFAVHMKLTTLLTGYTLIQNVLVFKKKKNLKKRKEYRIGSHSILQRIFLTRDRTRVSHKE